MNAVRYPRAICLAAALLAALITGCTLDATEVLVVLDSDAPPDRVLSIATVVSSNADSASGVLHTWTRGGRDGSAGIRLPASFAIIPGEAAPNSGFALSVTATVGPGPRGEPPLTITRVVHSAFVPRTSLTLRLFLAVACGARASGCTSVVDAQCTLSQYCIDRGQTCGNDARCTAIEITLSRDAGTVVDVTAMDTPVRDVGSDVRMDVPASTDRPCTPLCGTRVCGPDPACGITCGTCAAGSVCNASGQCDCVPQCSGRNCGADSCGGQCGACVSGQSCNGSGQCVAGPCVPNCSGLSCGLDPRCSTSCGRCTSPETCLSGTCGCSGGRTNCGGACVDVTTSSTHCGACGRACAAGQSCVSGMCRCPTGLTLCSGSCVDTSSNVSNCGSCGNTCLSGRSCMSGLCCQNITQRNCGGVCTDVTMDGNCGACGVVCGSGRQCLGGSCTACGALYNDCCGTTMSCNAGLRCTFNFGYSCEPCGGVPQQCCEGNSCNSGAVCNSTRTDIQYGCYPCGQAGQTCCAGSSCSGSLTCTSLAGGASLICTGTNPNTIGGPCNYATMPDPCPAGSICRPSGFCYACGGFNQYCCPNSAAGSCGSGLTCRMVSVGNYACQR